MCNNITRIHYACFNFHALNRTLQCSSFVSVHLQTIDERCNGAKVFWKKMHDLIWSYDKKISFSRGSSNFWAFLRRPLTISENLWKRLFIRSARKPLHDIRQLDEEKKETGPRSGRGTHARTRYVTLNSTAILPFCRALLACPFPDKALLPMICARFSRRGRGCPCYFERHRECRIASRPRARNHPRPMRRRAHARCASR